MRVRVTRAAAVMVMMMTVGLRGTCRRALKCLIRALALSLGRGSHGGDQFACAIWPELHSF